MPDKQCPCIECICKAVCRHKGFVQLIHDCILVDNYHSEYIERDRKAFLYSLKAMQDILKPTNWKYEGYNKTSITYNE